MSKKASDFFSTTDKENCPVTNCVVKPAGCEGTYAGQISISAQDALSATVTQAGWTEKVCVICQGEGKKVLSSDNISIQQTKCQDQDPSGEDACPAVEEIEPETTDEGEEPKATDAN